MRVCLTKSFLHLTYLLLSLLQVAMLKRSRLVLFAARQIKFGSTFAARDLQLEFGEPGDGNCTPHRGQFMHSLCNSEEHGRASVRSAACKVELPGLVVELLCTNLKVGRRSMQVISAVSCCIVVMLVLCTTEFLASTCREIIMFLPSSSTMFDVHCRKTRCCWKSVLCEGR